MPAKTTAAAAAKKFDALRKKAVERGIAASKPTIVTDEPYVLGADYGFETELRVEKPSLESLIVFQEAVNSGNALRISQTLLGVENTTLAVRTLDSKFETNDAEEIFVAIILDVIEHFFGADAGEVAGGFSL